jgi:NAD-dependent dihydropyrimidine dehydrogenase PreA subunit
MQSYLRGRATYSDVLFECGKVVDSCEQEFYHFHNQDTLGHNKTTN